MGGDPVKYTRKWEQVISRWSNIARHCQTLTDGGWTVHTILPTTGVDDDCVEGAIIVAFKDEPDLSGGVPR